MIHHAISCFPAKPLEAGMTGLAPLLVTRSGKQCEDDAHRFLRVVRSMTQGV
jgi:hypothetical protein